MNKQVEKHVCPYCESEFKLLYDTVTTSGYSKFCPFCSEEIVDEEDNEDELESHDDE